MWITVLRDKILGFRFLLEFSFKQGPVLFQNTKATSSCQTLKCDCWSFMPQYTPRLYWDDSNLLLGHTSVIVLNKHS